MSSHDNALQFLQEKNKFILIIGVSHKTVLSVLMHPHDNNEMVSKSNRSVDIQFMACLLMVTLSLYAVVKYEILSNLATVLAISLCKSACKLLGLNQEK